MRYRDEHGRFISEAQYQRMRDEPPEFDYWDDEYEWDIDLDPDEYEG